MDNESCSGTPEPTQCSWFDQALSSGVDSDVEPDYQNDQNESQGQNQEDKN